MITTSRYPSAKTREAAKRIAASLKTFYAARGKKTIDDIAAYARKKGEPEIIIIEEKDGIPAYASVMEVSETGKWRWVKRTAVGDYEM